MQRAVQLKCIGFRKSKVSQIVTLLSSKVVFREVLSYMTSLYSCDVATRLFRAVQCFPNFVLRHPFLVKLQFGGTPSHNLLVKIINWRHPRSFFWAPQLRTM